MGVHHLEGRSDGRDREVHGVVRVAGRGAVAATAALALTGAGGGLALATEGHEGEHGEHGWDSGWDEGQVAAADVLCDTDVHPDDVGGVLADLGLSGSADGFCSDSESSHHEDPHHSDPGHADSGHSDPGDHGGTSEGSEAQPAAEPAEDPAQDLPAPGETRTIDLPDRA